MKIAFDAQDMKPLITAVVAEVVDRLEADQAQLGDRIGFLEAEAAALVGVEPHVLRDCRLRGEISATRVGKRIVYSRKELLRFLTVSRK